MSFSRWGSAGGRRRASNRQPNGPACPAPVPPRRTTMDELQEKIARLPAWAREHIKRLGVQAEPNNAELRHLRQQVANAEQRCRKMQERVDIMTDLFTCAG